MYPRNAIVFYVFLQTTKELDRTDIPTQALVRVLAQKPGFKDNNFQVLKLKLEALKHLAENSDFTRYVTNICIFVFIILLNFCVPSVPSTVQYDKTYSSPQYC